MVYYPCGLEYIPSRQCNGGGKQRHIMWQCIMGWHGKRVRPQAAVCGTAGRVSMRLVALCTDNEVQRFHIIIIYLYNKALSVQY